MDGEQNEQTKKPRAPRYPRTSRCKRYRYVDEGGIGRHTAICLTCEKAGTNHRIVLFKTDPITLVRDRFLAEATEKNLLCKETHIRPIHSHAARKWGSEYWAVREGTSWKMSGKSRGPLEALKSIFKDRVETDPVLALGLEPSDFKRDDSRFDHRYEVVPLCQNFKQSDELYCKLKLQALNEEHIQMLAKRDIGKEIVDLAEDEAKREQAIRTVVSKSLLNQRLDPASLMRDSFGELFAAVAVHDFAEAIVLAVRNEHQDPIEVTQQAIEHLRKEIGKTPEAIEHRYGGSEPARVYNVLFFPQRQASLINFAKSLSDKMYCFKEQKEVLARLAERRALTMKPISEQTYQ
jgi:hypothetical protein